MPDDFTRQEKSAATQWVNQAIYQFIFLTHYVAMHPDAPYFIILLCLMPDDFTHQGKSAATQWVNQKICQCILLTH